MIGAILSDTKGLRSNTTTYADREAIKELNKLAQIPDIETFYQNMHKALISYEGMSENKYSSMNIRSTILATRKFLSAAFTHATRKAQKT